MKLYLVFILWFLLAEAILTAVRFLLRKKQLKTGIRILLIVGKALLGVASGALVSAAAVFCGTAVGSLASETAFAPGAGCAFGLQAAALTDNRSRIITTTASDRVLRGQRLFRCKCSMLSALYCKYALKNASSLSKGMASLPPPSYRSVCEAPGMMSSSLFSVYRLSRTMLAKASLPK